MGDGISDGPNDHSVHSFFTNYDDSPKVRKVNEFDEMIEDVGALMKADIRDRIEEIRKLFPGNER